MESAHPFALVAGVGPGLGTALMRRFESGGYRVAGLTRTAPTSEKSSAHLRILAVDLSDPQLLPAGVAQLIDEFGIPKVVIHNPARLVIGSLEQTALDDYESCWRSMAFSAAVLAKSVIPAMVQAGGGAFIVSGATASLRGGARFSAFASAKFALRGLTQSLAREFQPAGVHVTHVILDGIIDTPNSRARHNIEPSRMMRPDELADAYWHIAHQPNSCWSHEVDLRPSSETF